MEPLGNTAKVSPTDKNNNEEQQKIQEEIDKKYSSVGKYKVQAVKHKTILFLGRTRSGKSTIKSLLIDPREIPPDLIIFSETKHPTFTAYTIDDNQTVLNFIDTPGLFERRKKNTQEKHRDNKTILSLIGECLNREITRIDLVCFVIGFDLPSAEDVQAINELIKFLGDDICKNACLIVTHAESKMSWQCDAFKEQLNDYEDFEMSYFQQGVHFSGAINRDHWNSASIIIRKEFDTICEYRNKLIELFSQDIKPIELNESKVSVLQQKLQENKALTVNMTTLVEKHQHTQAILMESNEQYKLDLATLQKELKEEEDRGLQEIERLKQQLNRTEQEHTNVFTKLLHDHDQLSKENQHLKRNIEDQQQQFSQTIAILKETHLTEKHSLDQRIQDLTQQNTNLAQQIQNLTQQIQDLTQQNANLEQEIHRLNSIEERSRQSYQDLKKNSDTLKAENERLTEVIKKNKDGFFGSFYNS